ncbi:MAG TPA: porphobilinogen synthase [Planctomycetota bacterium]|nr:porphobilinogen synthase [Planctomycetota bacterium]
MARSVESRSTRGRRATASRDAGSRAALARSSGAGAFLRTRRLRRTAALREAVAQTRLHRSRLIQPHFVVEGGGRDVPIDAMPGIARQSVKRLVEQVGADRELGIDSVLLFGLTERKDARASAATAGDGLIPRAVAALKDAWGDALVVMTDVCLCGAMDHGHCGVLHGGTVLNDESLALLSAMAVAHAEAGADVVAPSDMMDGRVLAIRAALDAAGRADTALLSYSTKFASAFYGPFREAADSAPKSGDRRSYQADGRNRREALRESLIDVDEGADMLMVKPALAYLDVIADVRAHTLLPLAAYNVSGEYSMVKAAAARGWVDEARMVPEILTGMARAGADLIITYHAREALAKGWVT